MILMRHEDSQELESKIDIKFPREISTDKAESLLYYISDSYISDSRGCEISYRVDYGKKVGGLYNLENSGVEIRNVDISGTLSIEGLAGLIGFKLVRNMGSYTEFSQMQLDSIPGYTVKEHRPEVVQVWDDLKETIDQYFSK